jgi:ketosteroid isomerase-like protein
MSKENVKIVKAGFEAWNAGNMDAFRELFDPDVVMRNPVNWPEPGPFVGREAALSQFERVREIWEADTVEPVSDFIDVGDRVVVRHIWHAAGRGLDSTLEVTGVYTVRKRRIFYLELFWDHKEALEAAGPYE